MINEGGSSPLSMKKLLYGEDSLFFIRKKKQVFRPIPDYSKRDGAFYSAGIFLMQSNRNY